ncbi:hypothetical protein ACUOFC_08970, partial [Escherichia sp. TWPC-MK]
MLTPLTAFAGVRLRWPAMMRLSCPRWLSLDDKRTAFVPDPDRVKT